MFCPYCGSVIDNVNGFCPACGAQLGEAAGVPERYLTKDESQPADDAFSRAAQPDMFAADVRPAPAPAPEPAPAPKPAPAPAPAPAPEPESTSRPTYEVAYPAAKSSDDKMPSTGAHLLLVVIGFFNGLLFGILSLIQYNKMKAAIDQGDVVEARTRAQNVKIIVGIGVAISVLLLLVTCSQASSSYR